MTPTFKNFIFDIDGTIVESQKLVFDSLNFSLKKFGLSPLSPKDRKLFRKFGTKALIKKSKLPSYKIALIYLHSLKYKYLHLDQITPIFGVQKLLKTLKKRKAFLGVISSNNHKTIKKILKNCMFQNFEFYQSAGLFTKSVYLKRIIKKYNLIKSNTLYIGDEIRDVEAAHKAGIKIAAVTWGINSSSALKKAGADFLITSPGDLLIIK